MNTKKSFIDNYFEGKSGEKLKKTITPDWNTTKHHLKLLNIPKVSSILEVGCGIGRLLKELNIFIPICVGVDASKDMIREGEIYCDNTDVKLIKCDGFGEIPIKNEFFDYCYSIITFQHIPNTDTVKKYISEMYRLLKNDGIIKFQLLKNDEFPENDLWSYHNPNNIIEFMTIIGFTDVEIIESGRWIFINGKKININESIN